MRQKQTKRELILPTDYSKDYQSIGPLPSSLLFVLSFHVTETPQLELESDLPLTLLGKYNVRLSKEEEEGQHEDRNGQVDQVKMFEGFLKAVRKTKARDKRRVN